MSLSTQAAARRKEVLAIPREHPEHTIELLTNVLFTDSSPVIRHEAAFLLGASRSKEAINPLIWAIEHDESDLVRHEALEALGDLGIPSVEVIEVLERLSLDTNPFIRDTAEIASATLALEV